MTAFLACLTYPDLDYWNVSSQLNLDMHGSYISIFNLPNSYLLCRNELIAKIVGCRVTGKSRDCELFEVEETMI